MARKVARRVATESSVRDGLIIVTDCLDKIAGKLDDIITIVNKYNERIEPFKAKLADEKAIEKTLTALPPKRAALLISSLEELIKLFPVPPPEEAGKQLADAAEHIKRFKKVCANMHKALDV